MIFGRSKLELKVGVFVLVGVVILTSLVMMIGKFKTWRSGYHLNAVFNFVNGVKIGAPVRFAGVDVGEVKDVDVRYAPEEARSKVTIKCWVSNDVRVPIDSTVWINTLGLLGEKYVEIIPGKDYNNAVIDNQSITGTDPVATHELAVLAKKLVDDIDESILKIKRGEGTVGKLLYDDTIYKELEAAIKNKDGTIGKLFYDDSLYKELEGLISDIRAHPWKLFWKGKGK